MNLYLEIAYVRTADEVAGCFLIYGDIQLLSKIPITQKGKIYEITISIPRPQKNIPKLGYSATVPSVNPDTGCNG
jgi:hypothetical protein